MSSHDDELCKAALASGITSANAVDELVRLRAFGASRRVCVPLLTLMEQMDLVSQVQAIRLLEGLPAEHWRALIVEEGELLCAYAQRQELIAAADAERICRRLGTGGRTERFGDLAVKMLIFGESERLEVERSVRNLARSWKLALFGKDSQRFPIEPRHAAAMRRVGSFQVEAKIGEGRLGKVYCGRSLKDGRRAAIRVLNPYFNEDKALLDRILAEARSLVRLGHPHVVGFLDVRKDTQAYFIVMEYAEGPTLTEFNAARRIRPDRLAAYASQVASGIEAASACALVHGNIKPANIRIDSGAIARVLDYGHGQLLPAFSLYMAPEINRGKGATERSDVFSLGVVLHEILAGTLPFKADNWRKLADLYASAPRPDGSLPAGEGALGDLADLVGRMIRLDPDERPAPGDLAWELGEIAPELAAGDRDRDAPEELRLEENLLPTAWNTPNLTAVREEQDVRVDRSDDEGDGLEVFLS